MEIILEKLVKIMNKIVEFHEQLLDVVEKEKKALVGWETENILECAKKKEVIWREIQILEESRITEIGKLSEHLNIRPDITLANLILKIPGSFGKDLEKLRHTLLTLIDKLKYMNNFNFHVVFKTSCFLNNSIKSIMKGMKPAGSVYSKNGMIAGKSFSSLLNKNF